VEIMAISNIPRSVGHNFTPEYQISAVPFFALNSDADRVVVNINTGKIVATVNPVNDDNLGDDIWTRIDPTLNDNDLKANNLAATIVSNLNNGYKVIRKYEFKKITQWLQFKQPALDNANDRIKIYFSRSEAGSQSNNCIELSGNESTLVLPIRCVNIYMNDVVLANLNLQIRAGLTSIDRSEFTEVVETFLGDTE
jgi:hypothetical protein